MWYFAWILGTLLACSFGVITALALVHYRIQSRDNLTHQMSS